MLNFGKPLIVGSTIEEYEGTLWLMSKKRNKVKEDLKRHLVVGLTTEEGEAP